MQKTMDRLSTLNSFQYHGINQYYMVFRSEINGSYHWHYEWHDVDLEPHRSGYFHKIEHVIKHFVRMEQEHLTAVRTLVGTGLQSYSDDELMQIILTKIANVENPATRDWLLHKGE